MRINRVMAGAVASVLALGAVASAFADNDHRDRREWREDRREWRQDRRDWERDRREARRDWERDRRDWHRDHDRYYRPAPPPPRVVYRPAYGPGYGWKVGHRYRDYYRGPIYVVNDYPRYHLRRPPYGHQWIRDDRGNMLLVAIASGIIADYIVSSR